MGVLDAMFQSMRAFWLANAGASRAGSTLELPGVAAAVVPAMPERAGYPVYARLGYRDHGRVQMWERRRPAPGA